MIKPALMLAVVLFAGKAYASEELTGVPECDTYLKKYEACIMSKVPAASSAQMKTSFDQLKTSLVTMAKTPATKAQMPAMCTQQLEAAKAATASFGCTY